MGRAQPWFETGVRLVARTQDRGEAQACVGRPEAFDQAVSTSAPDGLVLAPTCQTEHPGLLDQRTRLCLERGGFGLLPWSAAGGRVYALISIARKVGPVPWVCDASLVLRRPNEDEL